MAWHSRVLERDPVRGMTEYYNWSDDGQVAISTKWDVAPIIADCSGLYNQVDERAGWKGDMHHVAVIPQAAVEDYHRKTGKNLLADKDAIRWWLNDERSKPFRLRPYKSL